MEQAGPRVSIIMGAYNCAGSIEKAILSIQEQDYSDWELIICEDCSRDDTSLVLANLSNKDSRIRVISNNCNKGLAYSLNHCLSMARGEYVARMDSDDIMLQHRLSAQVSFLDNNKQYSVVGGGITLYDDFGDKKILLNPEIPDVRMMKLRIPFFHPTIMMRRTAYESLGGYTDLPRTRRGQDLDLWFRFYAAGLKGYNLQIPVVKYHDDEKDQKKKNSIRLSWQLAKTRLIGYRMNKFPSYYYPFAFAHFAVALMPERLSYILHKVFN